MKLVRCDRCGREEEYPSTTQTRIRHVVLTFNDDPIEIVRAVFGNTDAEADLCFDCVATVGQTITERIGREVLA